MKKLERRAILCVMLAAFLVLGTCGFVARLALEGKDWASFYGNSHVFSNGVLSVGSVYDRNGVLLLENDEDGQHYNDDATIRKATLHVTGDKGSNIITGANVAFRSKMIGYNLLTGTEESKLGSRRKATLSIDSEINKVAYEALAGRNGFVCVYDWTTGEIICLVSTPTLDPEDDDAYNSAAEGTYINKAVSATFTPGSVFKLVTTAAAIENISNLDSWSFTCTGSYEIEGETVTCSSSHGQVDIYGALAKSCNCAYASLTLELGSQVMEEYAEKLGMTSSYNINGISSAEGSFVFDTAKVNLAWAGIGQYEDQVNPISLMVYMGAIAGGGSAKSPILLLDSKADTVSLLSQSTAKMLDSLMRNDVTENYGDSNFPNLNLRAKTGTAEVGTDQAAHGWFCGYSGNYAFVVCVENGGNGISSAAPIANTVLQAIVKAME